MGYDATSGEASRFSPVTDTDHAGTLWILAILAVAYSLLTAATRFYIKWGVLGADDGLFGIAVISLMAQAGVIFETLSRGLGKSNETTTSSQWEASGQGLLLTEILSIVVLCLSKCSVVALILRVLTINRRKAWLACCSLVLLCVVWAIGAVVALTINCDATSILTPTAQASCLNQWYRWQAITAGDIITELAVCLLPALLLWRVKMGLGSKFQVFFAFAFRLPLIAFSALHLSYVARLVASDAPLLAAAGPVAAQQAMLTWSLVSATIPNMKKFIKSFDMEFGVVVPRGAAGAEDGTWTADGTICVVPGGRGAGAGTAYQLQDIDKRDFDSSYLALRPETVQYEASAEAQDGGSSFRRSGSQEMIIRKDVQWEVQSSHGR